MIIEKDISVPEDPKYVEQKKKFRKILEETDKLEEILYEFRTSLRDSVMGAMSSVGELRSTIRQSSEDIWKTVQEFMDELKREK